MTSTDERDLDLVRKSARELARRFDLGYWREKDKKGEYPWEFVKAFADGGWLGAMIPEEYGGLGLGLTELAIMLTEVAASGAGMSGASAIHFYVFPPAPILRHGSEEMKRAWLPKLARSGILMAFGVTEPTAGVDTSRIKTRAEKIDGGWLVNGQKVWTTNGQNVLASEAELGGDHLPKFKPGGRDAVFSVRSRTEKTRHMTAHRRDDDGLPAVFCR